MKSGQRVVVSVGGSLIAPDEIDTDFLTRLRQLVLDAVAQGFSFFIIAGGGKTARRYQDAAHEVRGDLPRDDLDWLGIHATRLNAHLLRTLFREDAYPRIIKDPSEPVDATESVIIGAGWRPGWSTDYCAVEAAKNLGAHKLVNLSNTDYVYDKDPNEHSDAKAFSELSWTDFRALIPSEWDPGLSTPFDPIAAKEAQELGLEVAIINGTKLDEFSHYLKEELFTGTVIS